MCHIVLSVCHLAYFTQAILFTAGEELRRDACYLQQKHVRCFFAGVFCLTLESSAYSLTQVKEIPVLLDSLLGFC